MQPTVLARSGKRDRLPGPDRHPSYPMPDLRTSPDSTSQLPVADQIFLDHVGHFVADAEASRAAFASAGFTPTPASVQVNPGPAGEPPRLTGTGNVCAMLRGGYIETLFKTADTPLGAEHDAARRRYDGLHLVAFAIADAAGHHARLAAAGFPMQPLVSMQRPVDTADGPGVAAFEVVRVAPGAMVEGRVQVLRHLTESTVWQPRWLDHPNTARSLMGLSIVVEGVEEAAARFSRFTGRPAQPTVGGHEILLDRGRIEIMSADGWRNRWPKLSVPSLPFLGACTIEVASLDMARRCLDRGGLAHALHGSGIAVPFPTALGHGAWCFVEA